MDSNKKYSGLTIRRALRQARAMTHGRDYLGGPERIDLEDGGHLLIRNRRADGGHAAGLFVAERVAADGSTVTVYHL